MLCLQLDPVSSCAPHVPGTPGRLTGRQVVWPYCAGRSDAGIGGPVRPTRCDRRAVDQRRDRSAVPWIGWIFKIRRQNKKESDLFFHIELRAKRANRLVSKHKQQSVKSVRHHLQACHLYLPGSAADEHPSRYFRRVSLKRPSAIAAFPFWRRLPVPVCRCSDLTKSIVDAHGCCIDSF